MADLHELKKAWLVSLAPAFDECPLWVISGHTDKSAPCPLYPQERTLGGTSKSAVGYRFMSTRPGSCTDSSLGPRWGSTPSLPANNRNTATLNQGLGTVMASRST